MPTLEQKTVYATYADEEPVGFCVSQHDARPSDGWVQIPESLVARLISLGQAYDLHHVPMIDLHGETIFNSAQAQNVDIELRFLATVIRDHALEHVIQQLLPLVARVARDRSLSLMTVGP
jgi:hypothetical protein